MEIFDYGFKPKYEIPDDEIRRFGVEIELCKLDSHESLRKKGHLSLDKIKEDAQKISKYFDGWSIFKFDGSVQAGFEIVTNPLTLREQREAWSEELFYALNNIGFISFSAGCCGMHVHVSKRCLSNLQMAKVMKFIHNKNNRPFLKKIAQREDKTYATFSSKKSFGYLLHQKFKNRYEGINFIPSETIEFRLFKGTLNYKAFHKNLEFCESLINFCATGVTGVNESSIWWNYINYIRENSKIYPHLWEYSSIRSMTDENAWEIHRNERAARKTEEREKMKKDKGILPGF